MTAAMRAALEEDRWLCEGNEPQWLPPPYQWAVVQRWHDAGQRDQQHVHAVAYGTRTARALEHAVGATGA